MLVLTRLEEQCITIGEDILITVVRVGRRNVRIGIDAPRGVAVHRKEIKELIDRQRQERLDAFEEGESA